MLSNFLKHWRLNSLGVLLSTVFLCLSYWQYHRAQEKEQLVNTYQSRRASKPLTNQDLESAHDNYFYRAILTGTFDHDHTFLLDNRTYKGKIGYEIYTPFRLEHSHLSILVDRGFIPLTGSDRHHLPKLSFPKATQITGLLNRPPRYYSKGKMIEDNDLQPFIRIQYVDLAKISGEISKPLSPFILQLSEHDDLLTPADWQSSMMPKEKHLAYALQWFALSLTLLVLLVALNMRNKRK